MTESTLEKLQQHAERLSAEMTQKLEDARRQANGSTALIAALERVEDAAETLVNAARATGEGNPSHD